MFLEPDKALNIFSSKGKLTQCDNALKAALNSSLSIGCSSSNGCVIVSSKNISHLINKRLYHKVFTVCPTIGITYSGLQPDFRVQLEIAQKICQDYFDIYDRYPFIDTFINEFSLNVQEFTQKGGLRPFGTFLIFCGTTKKGPCCYQMDPSGSFKQVEVVASGKEYEEARKFVERRREELDDNIVNCLLSLREFAGRELLPEDTCIGVFQKDKFKVYDIEEVQEVFDSIK